MWKKLKENRQWGMMALSAVICQLSFSPAIAQTSDPTVMTINGQPVSRSEFEYSFNKNNSEGVIDKKSVEEYVDLFINYKLKGAAALDAKLDTLTSFKKEFLSYRDQQIKPSFVTDADVENEAKKYYDNMVEQIGPRGLFTASHILLHLEQTASKEEQEKAKVRIDSIYNALLAGADFAELAKRVSQDPGSARNGGKLPTLGPGQTIAEFETQAYALQAGEMSKPFLSPFGYHIIKMNERSQVPPYDSLRVDITRFIENRGIRERIVTEKLDKMVAESNGTKTVESLLDERSAEMESNDPDLHYLIQEYHDGLLLFEISNRLVWEKASKNDAALANYFKKNKKKYKWEKPRFKGIAYHVKDAADVKAVKNCVKGKPFSQWAELLRTTFNNDSVLRIRVEKGIFEEGRNSLVDRDIFKKNVEVKPTKDFPIDATFGKKLKAPQDYTDVRGLVVADYQEELEKAWVAELRKKYPVTVNKDVLATVNKH